MTEKIIDSFYSTMTGLCFIKGDGEFEGRYGGLTRTVVDTRENNSGSQVKRWPVSTKVSQSECWENQLYLNLVPDERLKSIVYFEEIGNKTMAIIGHRIQYRQQVRLVVWLNLQLLGYTEADHSISHLMDAQVHSIFRDKKFSTGISGLDKVHTDLDAILSFDKVIQSVFIKYNYEHQYQLFFYPFEALAYDITLTWVMDPNCLLPEGGICKEPIKC